MPAKKTAKKKAAKKATGPKKLGLFDHLNAVKFEQDPNYFDKISDADKTTWSNWMILRALSYNINYLPLASWAQKMLNLEPKYMYALLIELLPKQRTFDKFIKGKNEDKFDESLVSLISKHFLISSKEAIEYLEIFTSCDAGKDDLTTILQKYGYTDKEIKNLKL